MSDTRADLQALAAEMRSATVEADSLAYYADMIDRALRRPSSMHLRAWDLVRQMRNELVDAGLIDLHEYAWLAADSPAADPGPNMGSLAPRRLEGYDALRAEQKSAAADALEPLWERLADDPAREQDFIAVSRAMHFLRRQPTRKADGR